jgi:hypothetical protein
MPWELLDVIELKMLGTVNPVLSFTIAKLGFDED